MKKYRHSVEINQLGKAPTKYYYAYGNTKGNELQLSDEGNTITADLTRVYDKEEMMSGDGYLFSDAIKKALLLYLLKYSRTLEIKSITVSIDEETTEIYSEETKPKLYSMINGSLLRTVPKTFSSDIVFEHLLSTSKSKYDKRIASLFALLCSKSKMFETERFIYLWASFNGLYGWLYDFIVDTNQLKRERLEYKQIINLQKYYDLGNETISRSDSSLIAQEIVGILKDVNISCATKEYFEESKAGKLIRDILLKSGGKQYKLSAYGYLLTQLSYYFRCKIIHGSKPVFLFAYADDRELHSICILNNLLEEFIDDNLASWFDDEYVKSVIVTKAKDIKL